MSNEAISFAEVENRLVINGRFKCQTQTGVQALASSVVRSIKTPHNLLKPETLIPGALWEQFSLPKQLRRRQDPLLLNLCNTGPANYPNQIVTLHDMAVYERADWFHPAFRAYYRWLLPKLARNSRAIVTVSEFSKSEIIRHLGVSEKHITVAKPLPFSSRLKDTALRPKGIGDRPFLLFVGAHDPRKQITAAVEGLMKQRAWQGDYVVVGGSGFPFRTVKLNAHPDIRRIGYVAEAELRWLYEHCAAFIQPSSYEGFSLTPHEALAHGATTIVSDIPAHRENLAGKVTFFQPGDWKTLAEILNSVQDEPNLIPEKNSEKGFDWDEFIAAFL